MDIYPPYLPRPSHPASVPCRVVLACLTTLLVALVAIGSACLISLGDASWPHPADAAPLCRAARPADRPAAAGPWPDPAWVERGFAFKQAVPAASRKPGAAARRPA